MRSTVSASVVAGVIASVVLGLMRRDRRHVRLVAGNRVRSYGSGVGWGAAFGFAWWILGGLILMPLMLGMTAFAPLTMPGMQMVAMGSLVGHLIYGVLLGGLLCAFRRGVRVAA